MTTLAMNIIVLIVSLKCPIITTLIRFFPMNQTSTRIRYLKSDILNSLHDRRGEDHETDFKPDFLKSSSLCSGIEQPSECEWLLVESR